MILCATSELSPIFRLFLSDLDCFLYIPYSEFLAR